jgi:hypothetical protein
LYVTLYLCQSFTGTTEVVLYVTLYVCQSFIWQYRSSIVRHDACVNHLLVNTGVLRYVTVYLCPSLIRLIERKVHKEYTAPKTEIVISDILSLKSVYVSVLFEYVLFHIKR